MNQELDATVRAWIAVEPDQRDRATLQDLLDADNEEELRRLFGAPLRFGTAGLRGPEMPGPSGMNRHTVRRATQGVVGWLDATGVARETGVVVGRDARRGSEKFNDEVVMVLLGAGVRVVEMPAPLPTPLVPFVVKALGLGAGIMITASHNPARDNGYKLYDHSGSQIIPPSDGIVEDLMAEPLTALLEDRRSDLHHYVDDATIAAYRNHFVARFGVARSELAITYTPMHGVGGRLMTELFEEAGFSRVSVVASQFEPDGRFPTLAFPNPEEPGALDLAIRTAQDAGSSLVIANDPDADRLGVAVKDHERWRTLRGDEIGWLLASALLPSMSHDNVVATSIVSSTMLEKMAATANVHFVVTLTGFKWISRAAGSLALGFGYEEALGFAVDPLVADKDGMSAALAIARLAHDLAERGATLLDRLDEIETTFGVHAGTQLSLRAEGPDGLDAIRDAVQRLRTSPPAVLGGVAVSSVADLAKGYEGLAPTDGVVLELGSRGRVVVRPSGTEAKLKAYVEITAPPDATRQLAPLREQCQRTLDLVRNELDGLLAL